MKKGLNSLGRLAAVLVIFAGWPGFTIRTRAQATPTATSTPLVGDKPVVRVVPLFLNTLPTSTTTPTIFSEGETSPCGFSILVEWNQSTFSRSLQICYKMSGSAQNGVDYHWIPNDVFTPTDDYDYDYSDKADVIVHPIPDQEAEGAETITLTLEPGDDYVIGDSANATLTLTDSTSPTLSPTPTLTPTLTPTPTPTPTPTSTPAYTWIPYGVGDVYIDIYTIHGITYAWLMNQYGTLGYNVFYWDTPIRSGNQFTVDIQAQCFTGPHPCAVRTYTKTYVLGSLPYGNYTFMGRPFTIGPVTVEVRPWWKNWYPPGIYQPALQLDEGENGGGIYGDGYCGFSITRTGELGYPLPLNYTLGGGATNGADYASITTDTFTLKAGQAYTDIFINAKADQDIEGTETITLKLHPGAGYQLGESTSTTLSIIDTWAYNPANGHYYMHTGYGTWEHTRQEADLNGGYLATISSAGENQWVRDRFTGYSQNERVFIGLTWSAAEKAWRWDNGESLSYTNWCNGYVPVDPVINAVLRYNDSTWVLNGKDYTNTSQYAQRGVVEWDSIQLLSLQGVNQWEGGSFILVHWRTNILKAGTEVRFELWREGAKLTDLGSDQNAAGEGTATVRLPEVARDAAGCQIRVYSTQLFQESRKPDYITSDPFTIAGSNTNIPLWSWAIYE